MSCRSRGAFLTRIVAVLSCSLALGCGGDKSYRVSGTITFKGQPVPAGKIYFLPDGSKGNTGATGYANIKDGKYDTSATGGKGVIGGPTIIAIEGIDPSGPPAKAESSEVTAKVLFPRYETAAELPKAASTKDIEVPADAAKGPTQPKKDAGAIVP
jgi:hypothetical protein